AIAPTTESCFCPCQGVLQSSTWPRPLPYSSTGAGTHDAPAALQRRCLGGGEGRRLASPYLTPAATAPRDSAFFQLFTIVPQPLCFQAVMDFDAFALRASPRHLPPGSVLDMHDPQVQTLHWCRHRLVPRLVAGGSQ